MRKAALLLVPALLLTGMADAGEAEDLFRRGNEAYSFGQFEEAAGIYQEVLRYGVQDARVEYNLGNACYKSGDLGRAILHYRRAARLNPTDDEIAANLEYAESIRVDRVRRPEPGAVIGTVRWVQDRLGPDLQAMAVLILWWLVVLALARGTVLPGRWRSWIGWTAAFLLVLALILGVSWWLTVLRLEPGRTAVVLAKEIAIQAGPGENNAVLVVAHEGLDLAVRRIRDDWIQVALPDGLVGWVPRRAVGVV